MNSNKAKFIEGVAMSVLFLGSGPKTGIVSKKKVLWWFLTRVGVHWGIIRNQV